MSARELDLARWAPLAARAADMGREDSRAHRRRRPAWRVARILGLHRDGHAYAAWSDDLWLAYVGAYAAETQRQMHPELPGVAVASEQVPGQLTIPVPGLDD